MEVLLFEQEKLVIIVVNTNTEFDKKRTILSEKNVLKLK